MALHQLIQRLILAGVRLESAPAPPARPPPPALQPLIAALAAEHAHFDARAVHFGHRYRSGFWAIYLLSALAVAFAVMPLALGWDSALHRFHPFAGLWAVAEVGVIGLVSGIYLQGSRRDWQGQWLRARTIAELTWYLPLLAPLLDFDGAPAETNWYLRVCYPGQEVQAASEVARLCERSEPLARQLLVSAWTDPEFRVRYAEWAADLLEQQRHYHERNAVKQQALLHRLHLINAWLFGLTALGATLHLVIHSMWLSLATTFFPALGASLHGALAQSEAYRLASTSERLAEELRDSIERVRASVPATMSVEQVGELKDAIRSAITLILEEHQVWNLLVRPHHLPLA